MENHGDNYLILNTSTAHKALTSLSVILQLMAKLRDFIFFTVKINAQGHIFC